MGEVTPEQYEQWRESPLGAITDALEQEAVFALAGPLDGKRVLDVGTGDGTYALAAAARGASVVGVDLSQAMLETARRRAKEGGVEVEWQLADATALPFGEDTFDVVLAVTVLCFVPDAARAVNEMARVLRPGGHLVLGELGRWSVWAAWRRLRGWFGSTTWRSASFRTADELRSLVAGAGLTVDDVRGAVYYPPSATGARLGRPLDRLLGRFTTVGAAFLVAVAVRPAGTRDAGAGGHDHPATAISTELTDPHLPEPEDRRVGYRTVISG